MGNLIDKIKNQITPATSSPKARANSLKELRAKTLLLERQARYAETKATLQARAEKAKKRIKATKSYPHINTRLIVIGTLLLGVIILIIAKGC